MFGSYGYSFFVRRSSVRRILRQRYAPTLGAKDPIRHSKKAAKIRRDRTLHLWLIEPVLFGSLKLKSNLFLSPLAGYTNLPLRLTLREIGGLDLATTDLVNARSLLEQNPKALKLIETCPADRPLAVQLFGASRRKCATRRFTWSPSAFQSVDINMGCPVRKVCRVGGGSAMMTEIGQNRRPGPRHGRGRENPRHRQDAPGLGRSKI